MAPCSLKLPSLLKTFCLASSKKEEEEDVGHTSNSELKTHQVIIIGIQHRAIMKMKNWRKASLKLPESNKSDNVAYNEMDRGNAIDSESEEFFSVRSCFTQCCGEADEHFFDKCEGWPFRNRHRTLGIGIRGTSDM